MPPYRLSPEKRAILKSEVQKTLIKGVIGERDSPWTSHVVLVKKKDGSNRVCFDFRALKEVTRPDSYPMPRIDELFHASGKVTVFCSVDLQWGYWLIPLRVMAFGHVNAGPNCQQGTRTDLHLPRT